MAKSDQIGIPLEDAIQTNLETSTREELLTYIDLMGIDGFTDKSPMDAMKDALFSACGVVRGSPGASRAAARPPQSPVICPYNLSPFGKWGGRKRKISLPRPEGSIARAEVFKWDAKAPFWLPYDEVVSVPWPVYMIIVDTKMPRPKQVKTTNADGATEITTGWDHTSRSMTDHGDDPATSTLAGSYSEWYQEKGPDFYRKLGPRDLRTVAQQCDISTVDQDKRARPHDDVLVDVLIFLFGFANDIDADQEA